MDNSTPTQNRKARRSQVLLSATLEHDGAANAKLVGEIAFAREIVADPKAGVANMRLYGLDRLRDERLSLI